ncbi:4'-phosphopantetheinyl transferase family protein [Calothrix sp. 336/3]|uniref:4'-phosphopantetheinyl transferase family protein n=1 Tax=Calothrix sp. 336/3 TaxID=1337936 RepID=UPI000624638D|nr:4'-phosphopantetheinyl transferase superfamily protein [Calothrix sp. 336/3]AKG23076.1 4'-phosphopantetheinyl transferase [Calothrix sp. 336/3]
MNNEVHLWQIKLERGESELNRLLNTLSIDEIHRAERFRFPQHRQRFIVSRGMLRTILGSYLDVEAQAVQFTYEAKGKPILDDIFAESCIHFNLSHSQDLALCAVCQHHLVGVDLEYTRSVSDVESLAARFFSPREYEVVRSLPPHQQQQVFFRYWTCKEAYLKAIGTGITQLDKIEINLSLDTPASLNIDGDWSLFEFVPKENFRAAVVVATQNIKIKFLDI